MKTTLLRGILIPGALLGLSSVAAYAAPVDCSTILTVADAVNANGGGGCQVGNLIFSNFSFNFQSGTSNQSGTAPQLPPANDVALDISTDNNGFYSVVTDFSNSNPLAAVTATNSMTFELQYYVTETLANTTITEIDAGAGIGLRLQPSGTDAFGTYAKKYCANAAYGDTGGDNPIPLESCATSESTVQSSTWNSSNAATGDPTQSENVQNASKSVSLNSAGIYDKAFLSGGSHDSPAGQYQAALNNFENDFHETTADVNAPEPGTFLLLGGALIGLAAIRRKKSA